MVGDPTFDGWCEGEGVVEDVSDFFLLIRSAGGHVADHRLRVDEAIDAASRVGVELPILWRSIPDLLDNIRAHTEALGKKAKAKLRKALEISRVHWWRILSGTRMPSFPVLCRWLYLTGQALHLRLAAWAGEPQGDEAAEGDPSPDVEPRGCEQELPKGDEPGPDPAAADDSPPDPVIAAAAAPPESPPDAASIVAPPEYVAKPAQVGAFDPPDVSRAGQIDAFDRPADSAGPRGVAKPDRGSASTLEEPSAPISARPSARIGSQEKKRQVPSTTPSSSLSSSPMPLEFRRKSKVVGTVDSGVTDPDELKRIAFEALRNGVYPADSTPYINGQPVDMTVYHLERRIAEESKRREAEIAALERRLSDQLTTVIAEKIGEVMKEIDGVKTFTRETFAAVGTDIGQLREEFRATVERLVETPTLLREGLRELLRVAGGQKDDKKEKDHGN